MLKEVDRLQIPSHLPPDRFTAEAADRHGPTQEDYRAFARFRTPLPADNYPEVTGSLQAMGEEVLAYHSDPTIIKDHCRVLEAGTYRNTIQQLQGVWAGMYLVIQLPF